MSSKCNSINLEYLPEDIIYMIFDYLNFGDQLAAGSTCKRWRNIFFSRKFQKNKELCLHRVTLEDFMPPCMFLLMDRQPFINVHLIEATFNKSRYICSYIGEVAHSLILDTMNINRRQFVKLLKKFNNLESLTIKNCSSLLMADIEANTMKPLKAVMNNVCHLALPRNQYLTDSTFHSFTMFIKALKSLDLSSCPISFHKCLFFRFYTNVEFGPSRDILTFQYVSQVILQHKTHLKHLNLSSTKISNSALEMLAFADDGKSLQLEELHLASCTELSTNALDTFLQTQSNLMVLNLAGNKRVTDNLLKTLAEHLPRIEKLILQKCNNLTDDGLAFIVQLKNLRYLNISNCSRISGNGIKCHLNQSNDRLHVLKAAFLNLCEDSVKAIANYYSQLRVLDLSYCSYGVTDASMQFIVKHLRWLRSLSVQSCSTLTDSAFTSRRMVSSYDDFMDAIVAVRKEEEVKNESTLLDTFEANISGGPNIENLKGLQTLNLNYCLQITNITLFGIRFKELRQLYLRSIQRISIEGFISVVHFCPSLEEICLCECHNVTDAVINLITNKLHRLRRLHINACLRLTPLCCRYILRNCRTLKVLSIQRCPQLKGSIELQYLLNTLPTLNKVNQDN